MDNGSGPEIPFIVTEDLSSNPAIRVDDNAEFVFPPLPTSSAGHSRNNSDPLLLSPGIPWSGRRSFDTSADEDEHRPPPSPTLSTQSSVQFTTSTALRGNNPGDGVTSLALLSPRDASRSHSRRPSNATMTSTEEGTVADHSPGLSQLYPAPSNVATSVRSAAETFNSPTPTQVGSSTDIGDFEERIQKHEDGRRKVGGDNHDTAEEGEDEDGDGNGENSMGIDLTRDSHIDPTPFAFRPFHLASLVDPKNLDALEAMGGITGLLGGVGVDAANGLSIGERPSKSSDAPTVVVTDPSGEKAAEDPACEGAAFGAGVEDRQRVYGPNVLPVRKSRTLLELMWLALKDKVLVSPIHCSLVLPKLLLTIVLV